MAKKPKDGLQWRVERDLNLDELARELEELSAKGWEIVSILGPLSGGFAIVAKRMLTL
jgi:hypothetical protein